MNIAATGWEFEGGPPGDASQPLTAKQIDRAAQVLAFQKERFGWGELIRSGPHKTLYEHGEIVSTACPSGRIPWQQIIVLAKELDEEDDMATEEEREARAKAAGVFATAEAYAGQGIDPPKDIVDRVLMYASVWKRRLE